MAKKLLLTGGHLTPALAVIDYLQKKQPQVELIFAGREFAQTDNGQPAREQAEITARGLRFIPLDAPKSHQFNLIQFTNSYRRARCLLQEEKITQVLGFGGYLSVPVGFAAASLKIPLVIHEQTKVLGRANRLLAPVAAKIALSFPDTKGLSPFQAKVVTTGNPLREQLFTPAAAPSWFTPKNKDRPWLYVAGGSQGSRILLENFLPLLTQLKDEYVIIHQVGPDSARFHPQQEVKTYLRENNLDLPNYFPRDFLAATELAYFYPRLTLALTRAGANTVAELMAFRVPTLFVPLPQAHFQEQLLNAQAMADLPGALILPQANLTPLQLLENLDALKTHASEFKANLPPKKKSPLSAAQIAALLTFKPTPPAAWRQKIKAWCQTQALPRLQLKLAPKITKLKSFITPHRPKAKSRLKPPNEN